MNPNDFHHCQRKEFNKDEIRKGAMNADIVRSRQPEEPEEEPVLFFDWNEMVLKCRVCKHQTSLYKIFGVATIDIKKDEVKVELGKEKFTIDADYQFEEDGKKMQYDGKTKQSLPIWDSTKAYEDGELVMHNGIPHIMTTGVYNKKHTYPVEVVEGIESEKPLWTCPRTGQYKIIQGDHSFNKFLKAGEIVNLEGCEIKPLITKGDSTYTAPKDSLQKFGLSQKEIIYPKEWRENINYGSGSEGLLASLKNKVWIDEFIFACGNNWVAKVVTFKGGYKLSQEMIKEMIDKDQLLEVNMLTDISIGHGLTIDDFNEICKAKNVCVVQKENGSFYGYALKEKSDLKTVVTKYEKKVFNSEGKTICEVERYREMTKGKPLGIYPKEWLIDINYDYAGLYSLKHYIGMWESWNGNYIFSVCDTWSYGANYEVKGTVIHYNQNRIQKMVDSGFLKLVCENTDVQRKSGHDEKYFVELCKASKVCVVGKQGDDFYGYIIKEEIGLEEIQQMATKLYDKADLQIRQNEHYPEILRENINYDYLKTILKKGHWTNGNAKFIYARKGDWHSPLQHSCEMSISNINMMIQDGLLENVHVWTNELDPAGIIPNLQDEKICVIEKKAEGNGKYTFFSYKLKE